jgi:hypothetical protein
MSARGRDFERAFGHALPAHVAEVAAGRMASRDRRRGISCCGAAAKFRAVTEDDRDGVG